MTRFAATATMVLLVVAVVGMVLTTPARAVHVVQDDGTVIACAEVSIGTPLTLTFTHSMYGGDVSETWMVRADGLDRHEIATDNAAAAEYYAWDGKVQRAGNRFLLATSPLQQDRLVVRVDQIGQHRLVIGSEHVELAALVNGSRQVSIAPVTHPLWQGSPC